MKTAFIISALCCFSIAARCQTYLYDTKQICGNEVNVQKVLRSLYDTGKYCYIFHFNPNSCPRCEAVITDMYGMLPKDAYKVIIPAGRSKQVAKDYIGQFDNFKNKHVAYDTGGRLFKIVDQSHQHLNVPYLYKFDRIHNTVCYIQPLLGVKDERGVITKILAANQPVECSDVADATSKPSRQNTIWDTRKKIFSEKLPIQDFTYFKLFGHTFYLLEFASNKVLKFDTSGTVFATIEKSPDELFHYATSNDMWVFKQMKHDGMAKNIYVDVLYSKARHMDIVSCSLPQFTDTIDTKIPDTTIYSFNTPTFLFKNPVTGINELFYKPNTERNLARNEFVSDHTNFFELDNGKFAITTIKGYPAVGTDETMLEEPKQNPLIDSFYNFAPQFQIIDSSKICGFFGREPKLFKRLHTGYYYAGNSIIQDEKSLITYNKYSGDILIYDKKALLRGKLEPKSGFTVFPEKQNIPVRKVENYKTKIEYIQSYTDEMYVSTIQTGILHDGKLYLACIINNELQLRSYSLDGVATESYNYRLDNKAGLKDIQLAFVGDTLHIWGLEQDGANFFLTHLKKPVKS